MQYYSEALRLKVIRILILFSIVLISFPIMTNYPAIHNCATNFVDFWNKVKDWPLDQQIKEFEKAIYPTFKEYYQSKFSFWEKNGLSKEIMLKQVFDEYKSYELQFVHKTSLIGQEFKNNLAVFLKHFPDLDMNFDIYIIHSLHELDGGIRTINQKSYFILGIDGIVKWHTGLNDNPFFYHELFHVYHAKFFNDESKLWQSLWIEGLATYVSEILNDGNASTRDLLLDIPEGMIEACEKNIKLICTEILEHIDSNDKALYQKYFSLSSKDQIIPKRAGYYIGYLIAKNLGKRYSIAELVLMDAMSIKDLIITILSNEIRIYD